MNDTPEIHARPKIIGARIKRSEDPRLLTGVGAYTDDRQVMRVLHVAFRRSDQSHARIRAIDCTAARAAPGCRYALRNTRFAVHHAGGLAQPLWDK